MSLTAQGATGADSTVAVERLPTADASGRYLYTRTFDLPSGVTADDVRRGVIVVHGSPNCSATGRPTTVTPAAP